MLKRVLSIFTVLCFLLLGGCDVQRELDKGYMLTSIGFENAEGGIRAIAELLSVSDTQGASPAPQVFSAIGETPENALYNLSLDFPRAVYFDHCAVLAIGDGIEAERLEAVIKYCANADNLNLNMYVICSPDIEVLLRTPTVSSSVGYHIMRLISFKAKESGLDYNSRFYEIKKTARGALCLPSVSGGDEISLGGSVVFLDYKSVMSLSNTEGIAYAFIRGDFKDGRVSIGREYADIKRVKYEFFTDNAISARITATLYTSNTTDGFYNALQSEADALIARACGVDIFEIQKRAAERGIMLQGDSGTAQIKYKVEKK